MTKPKDLEYDGVTILRVQEDFHCKHFQTEDEPLGCDRDAYLHDESIFDGYSNQEQKELAGKMANWFRQYAKWIGKQNEGVE